MSLAARSAVLAALVACLVAGGAEAVVIDRLGPAAGLAVPVGAAVAAAVLRRPIVGVQLALLAVPLEFFSLRVGGSFSLSATEMLFLLTAVAALLRWAMTAERPAVPAALKALAALCVVTGVGFAVAVDTAIVTKILLMWSAFVVVGVLVANAGERDVTRVIACVAIAGGVAGAIAVAGGTDQRLVAGGLIATNRAQATFAQPNVLGFFLVMAIPAAVVLSARGRPTARVVMVATAAAAIWGLMLSLSRTSLVGTGLALGLLLLMPAFRRIALVGMAALALFALVNLQALQESQQLSVVSERLASLGRSQVVRSDYRYDIYRTTPSIIESHPLLGVGAGNYSVAAKQYALLDQNDLPFDHAHDVPLTIAAELGLVGLLAFLWLAVAVARLAARAVRARGDPRRGHLLLGLAATMAGVTVISLGDYPPRTNAIAATFIVLVAALAALVAAHERSARPAATPLPPSGPR